MLKYAIALAFLGLSWLAYSNHADLLEEQKAHLITKQAHTQAIALAEKRRADEESKRRKAEQELGYETERHGQEVLALRDQLLAVRSDGRRVAERLRNAASEAAATAIRAGQVCADPGSPELRTTTEDTILVLTELREQADRRAGELAEFASEAHLAGLACERRYDEAREKLMAY